MRLEGKVVLLTGASSGMGKDMALLFAKEGAKVVAVARRKSKLDELSNEATGLPGEVVALEGDVTQDADIDHMVEYTMDKYKRIDVLVNNAGIIDNFTPLGELNDELWDKVLNVNLTAPMKLSRKVLSIMLNQEKGNIINISSLGGLYGSRAGTAYTASKFGLIGITKNIAYMYAEKGIRCNAICPGGVETEILSKLEPSKFGMERVMKGATNNIRSGTGKEIANIALFLASDESSFVNGDQIVADAGWTAY
ncbi:NAD(P)-dependent dehydrogenase, short-chain alcohol dehydrogenase family [Desulfonispora thiosulfatigenes DSM 11270]|uniref:NAD(P)-dependent dehydrogenase, short-chain alcohol dehydrogenase family n=1 Tax=Desulfonispora thiosulfatigenes DSM 11270 TaxID=656914 RepID=A0A1W1V9M5_DESTI|nr:SDR family NAD(P)-dependent oxidoreductase [Desulfonispora thiosulfatigenes]SMB89995.1 NAD(P)-dependent dehydrogenase, short-chain alcohol dehydrogenase family [Desulfonispora thiosulfatigenes DSM 11270]